VLAVIVTFITNVLLQEKPAWYHRFLENARWSSSGVSPTAFICGSRSSSRAEHDLAGKMAVNIVASLVVGWLSYSLIEQPFIRLKDKFFPAHTKKTPVDTSSATVAVPTT